MTEFISFMSSLRTRRSDLLQKSEFLKEENIEWHGSDLSPPNWEDPTSKFLAMTLKAEGEKEEEESQSSADAARSRGDLFVAFNAADQPESVTLPAPPAEMAGSVWLTQLAHIQDFSAWMVILFLSKRQGYSLSDGSHSCILFEARSLKVKSPPSLSSEAEKNHRNRNKR